MNEKDPTEGKYEGKQGKDRSRLVSREPRTIALENRRDFIIAPADGGKRASESPPQHLKVIQSPEGSVNCFSRRELAEGSEDRSRCAADSFE